jgi:PAS domain S-box-containing protein
VLYANEALHNLTQNTLSAAPGFSLRAIVAPTEVERLDALIATVRDSPYTPHALETLAVSGVKQYVPIELSVTPVLLSGLPAIVVLVSDLRERKRTENELRSSEARFQQLVNSAPDAVFILNGTRIQYCNPSAIRLLDWQGSAPIVGEDLATHLKPTEADLVLSLEGLTHNHVPNPQPFEVTTLGGRALEVSAAGLDYEGRTAVFAFARDVTERKAIQSRLLQADRLAAVGMLAAGVAHEINNPLTYVLLNLKYLARELGKLPIAEERRLALGRHVDDAVHGAERVQTIVRDLRTFARADNEPPGPVHLTSTIEGALALADHELRHCAVVHQRIEADFCVNATSARLEQVFLNLLINAAQAVGPGKPSENFINIDVYRRAPSSIVIRIRDSGPGISPAARERVFEPFFTTKPASMGTGLGLPICKSIVESFGGTIRLEPTLTSGTEVIVELCEHPEEPPAPSSRRPLQSPASPRVDVKPRLLIVDDETAVASMLGRFLEPSYEVVTCRSGAEALTSLASAHFDVILCDLMMPNMTGMDFYYRLKSLTPELERRVIFMTGGALLPEVSDFLSQVDTPRVDKPFNLDELSRILERVIRESSSRLA